MNKSSKNFGVLFLVIFLVSIAFLSAYAQETRPSYTQRMEIEDKIQVPKDKADEIWNYLYETYVKDQTNLTKIDPTLSSYLNEEEFIDVYFDTPKLELLDKQNSVRHRKRQNFTNPSDTKNGREIMQLSLSNTYDNPLARGTMKWDVEITKKDITEDSLHPMIGLVTTKKNQRQEFKDKIVSLGFDPYVMKPTLTLNDYRKRIYILKDNLPYITLSFDHVSSQFLWAKADFFEIEPEITEDIGTYADEATKKRAQEIEHLLVQTIENKFNLKGDLTPKYNKVFSQFEKQLPFLRIYVKYGENLIIGVVIIFLALLVAVCFLVKMLVSRIKLA